MSNYRYLALDAAGRKQRGEMKAGTLPELDLQLKHLGLDLIDARASTRPFWQHRLPPRTGIMLFFLNLGQLCRAGVPLVDSLVDLHATTEHASLRNSLGDLLKAIKNGNSLSNAMAQQPKIFEPLLVSMVKTGEESGRLPEVLTHIGELLTWRETLTQQLKTALLYPTILAITIAAVTLFLMTYLVPQLTAFLLASGQALPWQTRMLISLSEICRNYWIHTLILIAVLWLTFYTAMDRIPGFRIRLDRYKLRCWLLGPLLQKIILARLASAFAMMYRAGLSVFDCLTHLQPLLGNRVLSGALTQIRLNIEGGRSLTDSFRDSGLFPAMVTRMVHIGETTGGLDEALLNITELYNRDIQAGLRRMQLLIEPAMTLVLGAFLGWIMLAVLGPIYDLIAASTIR